MPGVLLSLAVDVALICVVGWIIATLAELRRGQAAIKAELERIGQSLGVPPRAVPMVRCERCQALYDPELTGCPTCGAAKPRDAKPILAAVRGA